MEKPLEIKRIDLLVHPFFYDNKTFSGVYSDEEALQLFELWKGHIDEVAKDPNRLLLVVKPSIQTIPQKKRSRALVKYAKEALGKRCGFFRDEKGKNPFQDNAGKPFGSFEEYAKATGFSANPLKVKTRAFGEYLHVCVTNFLCELNAKIGMPNVIPYRNPQSTLLFRKTVGPEATVKEMLAFKELAKSYQGRQRIRAIAAAHSKERRWGANLLAKSVGLGKGTGPMFKPRQKKPV